MPGSWARRLFSERVMRVFWKIRRALDARIGDAMVGSVDQLKLCKFCKFWGQVLPFISICLDAKGKT